MSLVDPCPGELIWRELAVSAVWTVQVVVDPSVLDEHPGLEQAVEVRDEHRPHVSFEPLVEDGHEESAPGRGVHRSLG